MMIRTSTPEQVRAWKVLAELADEVGDNLPCRQAPDLFFATQSEWHFTALAKKACEKCPLKDPCATYAIQYKEDDGIWGGTTPGERKRLRRTKRSR